MIDSQFNKTCLPNGVRVVTEKMFHVRSVSIGVWVRAGSRDENVENNGISHFLEHMLFKGTHTRTAKQIAQSLESKGGSLNGYTGKEISCYTAHVLDENVTSAFDVLSDILLNSKFSKHDINNEKEVILSEINHYLESPDEIVFEHLYQHLFPEHPLGFFIHGTPENVQRFSRPNLIDFLHENYTTNRIVIAAAGNLEHDDIIQLVTDKFSFPPAPKIAQKDIVYPPDANYTEIDSETSQQAHICVGVKTFPFSDSRKYALIALELLLGGGMSSRLFQNIREKYGFAYNVYSFSDFLVDTGVLGFYLACAPTKVGKSLELLEHELKKIQKNSIKKNELDQIKSQIKGGFLLGLESSSRRMRRIGELEIYESEHLSWKEVLSKIEQLSTSDLAAIADEFLNENRLVRTILKPYNSK